MENLSSVKKAVIPTAGLGTRFLPLSKIIQKELFPLADKPIVQYLVEEAINSGIKEIIFVVQPRKTAVLDYFKKPSEKIEKIIKQTKKDYLLERLKNLEELSKNISFSFVQQKKPLGDGNAVLQAKKIIKEENFAVLFSDDIVESKTPAIEQMLKIFKTCQKPVAAIHRLPKEKLPSYGVVKVEKIANRLFKIKGITEKPKINEAPSDLAVVGKYILTPEIFEELEKTPNNERGELILADALASMIKNSKAIYGYEFEGEWWECGNFASYIKSNLHFCLKHPEYGQELKKYLKEGKYL